MGGLRSEAPEHYMANQFMWMTDMEYYNPCGEGRPADPAGPEWASK